MRYRILLLIGTLPLFLTSQNPLKKELKGNTTSMHYSPSQFTFTNQAGVTVFVTELKDKRSLNWNKQVNDSVRIEAIGDYWNFPFNVLFKNKINQDLTKANLNVNYSSQGDNIYKIEPSIDVLYPNFVSFPKKGYWVLSKINMQVSKGVQTLFTKSYQEYTFFTQGINGYNTSFEKDLKEGANVAMWSSMKRLLDQFYIDLNDAFSGKTIQSSDIALNTVPSSSNIANDENLNNKVSNYSGSKPGENTNTAQNNYKMDGEAQLPPPTDSKLDKAVNVLGGPIEIRNGTQTSPKTIPTLDSAKLAERKLREAQRKQALDSAKKAKDDLTLAAKKIEEEEKVRLQAKRDSILKVKKDALALKLREKSISDSLKKVEINQKIEIAKKKREEEKAKFQPKSEIKVEEKKAPIEEKTKPTKFAKKPLRKTNNESVADAVKRIASEVEAEEYGGYTRPNRTENIEPLAVKRTNTASIAAQTKLNEQKEKNRIKDSLLAIEKQKKQDSLLAIRKAKAEAIEQAMARAKGVRDSMNRILAAKKYVEDSIQLIRDKEQRREAVLAAQKAAMEAERAILSKNPNAAEMFAIVSTDPPSKLPDNRTREQVLADRVFVPKSDEAKNLLARVKLITPEEEARMLAQMKTEDRSVVDSFFIQVQKNRPIPTYKPLDTVSSSISMPETKKDIKSKEDKKTEIIEKGLKNKSNQKISEKTSEVSKTIEKAILEEKKEITSDQKQATTSTNAVKDAAKKTASKAASTVKEQAKNAESEEATPPVVDDKKVEDLENEIDKKTKELKEKLNKAKAW